MMRKTVGVVIILVLVGLAVFSMQASANPSEVLKDQTKTPGAKATEKAIERTNEAAGEPTDKPGKPEDKGKLNGKRSNYKGIVASIDGASLSVTLADGSNVSFVLDENTRIKVPTNKDATAADILVGVKVTVQAVEGEDGVLTARHVLLIPGKKARIHHVGTVTDYQPGVSITITAQQDGLSYTFTLSTDTKILPVERAALLAAGSRVTIISSRDVTGVSPSARGIVVHPEGSGPKPTETVTP